MELTMDALVQQLKGYYRIVNMGGFFGDFSITDMTIYSGNAAQEHTLCLCPEGKGISGRNALYIVTDETMLGERGWYLICGEGGIYAALDRCFRVWESFRAWRETCRELALIEHDLTGLLEAGARFLNTEMVIIDREYRYDGSGLPQPPGADTFFSSTKDMDADAVENLYAADPKFDETFRTDGLVYYPHAPVPGARVYYYNLRYDRLYLGRLLYSIPDPVNTPALRALAEQFGALVEKCYEFHYLRKNKGMPRHSVYDLWKQLLEGKSIDREEADRRLAAMDWEPGDRFRILYLLPNGYVRSQETLKFYAVRLEQTFCACIAVQREEGIFLLHNLEREPDPDFRQHLADFLRENLFLSGISNGFSDFYDSRRYSFQAKDALELGVRVNPSLWRHEFREYQEQYVFQQCLSRYSARDLCPSELEKLLLHDEANPEVELARTLETYYNCKFNAAEAAKQLYIHRTTFFYRLNKIRQIAAIDFDDPDQRLQILLYFALAREEQRTKGKVAQ